MQQGFWQAHSRCCVNCQIKEIDPSVSWLLQILLQLAGIKMRVKCAAGISPKPIKLVSVFAMRFFCANYSYLTFATRRFINESR